MFWIFKNLTNSRKGPGRVPILTVSVCELADAALLFCLDLSGHQVLTLCISLIFCCRNMTFKDQGPCRKASPPRLPSKMPLRKMPLPSTVVIKGAYNQPVYRWGENLCPGLLSSMSQCPYRSSWTAHKRGLKLEKIHLYQHKNWNITKLKWIQVSLCSYKIKCCATAG